MHSCGPGAHLTWYAQRVTPTRNELHMDITPETRPDRAKDADGRRRLSSVATAIELLKAFSEDEVEFGISALAKRLGVAKSTAHRLATTLVSESLLEQDRATGKYRLG